VKARQMSDFCIVEEQAGNEKSAIYGALFTRCTVHAISSLA